MTTTRRHRPLYWERLVDADGGWRSGHAPPGEELAALRRGAGKEAGTVPAMWPFVAVELAAERLEPRADAWEADPSLLAEHHALVLFGIHQQSKSQPMHRPGTAVARSIGRLRRHHSQEAIDRRFAAAVTAVEVNELAHHLRSLVRLLRPLEGHGAFDYSRLAGDLERWVWPTNQPAIRRRWGLEYESQHPEGEDEAPADGSPETEAPEEPA